MGEAYKTQKNITEMGGDCWLKGIHVILTNCDLRGFIEAPDTFDEYIVREKLQEGYRAYWKSELENDNKKNGSNKMRTYRQFKVSFSKEEYLTTMPKKPRSVYTRYRISAHNLGIESGRYTKTPVEERLCRQCTSKNNIEDEYHIFVCVAYTELREKQSISLPNRKEFSEIIKASHANTILYINEVFKTRNAKI